MRRLVDAAAADIRFLRRRQRPQPPAKGNCIPDGRSDHFGVRFVRTRVATLRLRLSLRTGAGPADVAGRVANCRQSHSTAPAISEAPASIVFADFAAFDTEWRAHPPKLMPPSRRTHPRHGLPSRFLQERSPRFATTDSLGSEAHGAAPRRRIPGAGTRIAPSEVRVNPSTCGLGWRQLFQSPPRA